MHTILDSDMSFNPLGMWQPLYCLI